MRLLAVLLLAALPLSAQAQRCFGPVVAGVCHDAFHSSAQVIQQTQAVDVTTVVDATPDTQLIDSTDVQLPNSCEFRGQISRGPSLTLLGNKTALRRLHKAAAVVDANVIVVTVLNLNSGIPVAGLGYHCADLREVAPSLKVYVLPQ